MTPYQLVESLANSGHTDLASNLYAVIASEAEWTRIFDSLKPKQRILIAAKSFGMGGKLFDGQYHEWVVGRKSRSKKYGVEAITLLQPGQMKAGPAMGRIRLYKRDGKVSLAQGDMAMMLKGLKKAGGASATADMDPDAFNKQLARELGKFKRTLGATKVRQGYKGTGGQKHRRQIWIDLPQGTIDIFLETNSAKLGGVMAPLGRGPDTTISYEGKSPKQVADEISKRLKAWGDKA